MGMVACNSGKYKGQTKISYRDCKRLWYWLFREAKSAVSHEDEFKQLYVHYTTRAVNPIEKDAIINRDSLQACKGDLQYPEDRDNLWPGKTAEGYQTSSISIRSKKQ